MDIKTFILVFTLANLFVFVFLLFYAASSEQKNTQVKIYAVGKLLMGIAWLLFSLRDKIPNLFSVALGNILLFWGICFEVFALSTYAVKNTRIEKRVFVLLGTLFSFAFIGLLGTPEQTRVLYASYFNAAIFFAGVFFLWKYKQKSKLHIFALGMYLFLASLLTFRGFSALMLPNITLTSSGLIQSISYASFLLITFLSSIMLLLLLKEQDDIAIDQKNNDIVESNRLLAESNETKDRLFSIIAHDLRGPVGAISQLGEILHMNYIELDEDQKQRIIGDMFLSSKKTNELLNNLLSWARSQLNEIVVKKSVFKLLDLIEEVEQQLASHKEKKEIELKKLISQSLDAHADYEMLQVVVRNLLSNAIKFSNKKGKITIEAKERGNLIDLSISDQGKGIPPEVLTQLLQVDFHHTSPGTENEKGSGIGLKLCKDFIERNNGTLKIESKLLEGSTFSITIPIK